MVVALEIGVAGLRGLSLGLRVLVFTFSGFRGKFSKYPQSIGFQGRKPMRSREA